MLDVFNQNAFSVLALTDAINKVPFVPSRAGEVIDWSESGVTTTTVMLEDVDGKLQLINPTPRGGPGETIEKTKRKARNLIVPHYEVNGAVMADEVQGVRAFGAENQLQTVRGIVDEILAQHVQWNIDPTLEYQRIGAIKGVILNGDGSQLYNLFSEFGVTQEAEVDFDLDNADPAPGAVRTKCTAVIRLMRKHLGGLPVRGIRAFCGDTFWDQLIEHPEVRDTFKYQEGVRLREGVAYSTLDFGEILFENYRGEVDGTKFVDDAKCHVFPVGVPGLWRTVYAPADYIETVNTRGLPRYSRQYPMPNGKGVHLDSQTNAINYCTIPKTLIKARNT